MIQKSSRQKTRSSLVIILVFKSFIPSMHPSNTNIIYTYNNATPRSLVLRNIKRFVSKILKKRLLRLLSSPSSSVLSLFRLECNMRRTTLSSISLSSCFVSFLSSLLCLQTEKDFNPESALEKSCDK